MSTFTPPRRHAATPPRRPLRALFWSIEVQTIIGRLTAEMTRSRVEVTKTVGRRRTRLSIGSVHVDLYEFGLVEMSGPLGFPTELRGSAERYVRLLLRQFEHHYTLLPPHA